MPSIETIVKINVDFAIIIINNWNILLYVLFLSIISSVILYVISIFLSKSSIMVLILYCLNVFFVIFSGFIFRNPESPLLAFIILFAAPLFGIIMTALSYVFYKAMDVLVAKTRPSSGSHS